MALVTHPDRRSGDRRLDGVTAKILRAMLSMRREFGAAAAKNLLLRNGIEDEVAERVVAVPEERRAQGRRTEELPSRSVDGQPMPAEDEDDGAVMLDEAGMAILHRLRFEVDSGMRRMSIGECPVELQRLALIQPDDDGKPVITGKGRRALKHCACVRVLDRLRSGVDTLMMSEETRTWLESNLFLQRTGNGYKITELGDRWLEFNRSLAQKRALL